MDIKSELEALRDEYARLGALSGLQDADRCREIAGDLTDIIARLPPDAVVVRGNAIDRIRYSLRKGEPADWARTLRAMLQAAEENSDDRG